MNTATTEPQIEECFAVPGQGNIIDIIHPATGLGAYSGETLAQVQLRYPGAIRLTLQAWQEQKAKEQDSPITWHETTEEVFMGMLECLPPAAWQGGAFLVGEPSDHHALTGRARFACYKQEGDKYYGASRPLHILEFKEMFPKKGRVL